jgi:hypothetical protein
MFAAHSGRHDIGYCSSVGPAGSLTCSQMYL